MPNIGMQSNKISDPYMQAVAQRVLHTLQIAAEKAIAHSTDNAKYPIPTAADSAEQIFLSRYKSGHHPTSMLLTMNSENSKGN